MTELRDNEVVDFCESNDTIHSENQIYFKDQMITSFEADETHGEESINVDINKQSHMNPSKTERPKVVQYECDVCAIKFTTKRRRKRHFTSIHELQLHNCNVCGEDFKSQQMMKTHQRTKHDKHYYYY